MIVLLLLFIILLLISDNNEFSRYFEKFKKIFDNVKEGFDTIVKNGKELLHTGLNSKPTMWIFYRTDEINSRHWKDFGSRNSRSLNMPFLNLCYTSIQYHNEHKYNIIPIMGIEEVAHLLGGWENMPMPLQNHNEKYLEDRELNWIMTAILSKYGGLWVSPYTICMKPFEICSQLTFYGSDMNENLAGEKGTLLPGFHCVYSPLPGDPFMVEWENICFKRVEHNNGGQLIRNDIKWDWISLSKKYNYVILSRSEGSRKKDRTRLQIEDILSSTNTIDWVDYETVHVPIYYKELRMFRNFIWFIRISEEQIMLSNTAIKRLLDISLQ